jgi:hypothetical protein
MNTIINNKDGRKSAAWTALFVLSLLAAMVLVAPTGVFAQITGQLSQDCDYALVGTEHTITATVTDGGAPYAGGKVYFWVDSPGDVVDPPSLVLFLDENGIATFPHTVSTDRDVAVTLYTVDANYALITLGNITTTWTKDEADPDLVRCSDQSDAPDGVTVGGKVTLNAKKKGALTIAVCGSADLDVNDVNINSVTLVGVAPFHWKQKDSRLCPAGKDEFVDLEFKFKNREVVEALGPCLEEGQCTLALTGNLNDNNKTAFGGDWVAEIKNEGRKHWKKSHSNSNENNGKGKGPKK